MPRQPTPAMLGRVYEPPALMEPVTFANSVAEGLVVQVKPMIPPDLNHLPLLRGPIILTLARHKRQDQTTRCARPYATRDRRAFVLDDAPQKDRPQ